MSGTQGSLDESGTRAFVKYLQIDHDDLCLVPGCERKGSWKYPCKDKEKVLGYMCIPHGWKAAGWAKMSLKLQGRLE